MHNYNQPSRYREDDWERAEHDRDHDADYWRRVERIAEHESCSIGRAQAELARRERAQTAAARAAAASSAQQEEQEAA